MTAAVFRRFLVSGRVQGVFFRASAAQEAASLGLRGSAVNLPDGRVEVVVAGSASAVRAMERWLERGPPLARVESVAAMPVDAETLTDVQGFSTA
jgi:acylphosphatase